MLLLSTESLRGYSLDHILYFCQKIGINAIDLSLEYGNHDFWDIDYILEKTEQYNISIYSITAPSRSISIQIVDDIIELGRKLKSQIITFTPPHFSDKDTDWYYNYLPKLSKKSDITISIQNVEPNFLFFVIPERKNASLIEIKKITGNTSLDLSNVDINSMDIIKANSFLGGSIKNIFLNDRTQKKTGLVPGKSGNGLSYLPIESLLMKLKMSSYKGFITIKVNPSEIGAGDSSLVLSNLNFIIDYYKKHFENYS